MAVFFWGTRLSQPMQKSRSAPGWPILELHSLRLQCSNESVWWQVGHDLAASTNTAGGNLDVPGPGSELGSMVIGSVGYTPQYTPYINRL